MIHLYSFDDVPTQVAPRRDCMLKAPTVPSVLVQMRQVLEAYCRLQALAEALGEGPESNKPVDNEPYIE